MGILMPLLFPNYAVEFFTNLWYNRSMSERQIEVYKGVFMIIRVGNGKEKELILSKYPYTAQVMHQGGNLIVAIDSNIIIGFAWSFRRDIPVAIGKTEDFINVIEVFDVEHRCKGIGSLIVKKCIDIARECESYQVRAYCDVNNVSSQMLWAKNGFTVSPVKLEDGQIVGAYVAYKL